MPTSSEGYASSNGAIARSRRSSACTSSRPTGEEQRQIPPRAACDPGGGRVAVGTNQMKADPTLSRRARREFRWSSSRTADAYFLANHSIAEQNSLNFIDRGIPDIMIRTVQ